MFFDAFRLNLPYWPLENPKWIFQDVHQNDRF